MTNEQIAKHKAEMRTQANRLHHLSMMYVGSIAELAEGRPLGLIASDRPGIKVTRDILDLMLLIRAEVNGLCKILIDRDLVTADDLTAVFAAEYKNMADVKAAKFGCEATDAGLVFKKEGA